MNNFRNDDIPSSFREPPVVKTIQGAPIRPLTATEVTQPDLYTNEAAKAKKHTQKQTSPNLMVVLVLLIIMDLI